MNKNTSSAPQCHIISLPLCKLRIIQHVSVCQYCGKVFNAANGTSQVWRHINAVHLKLKPYKCLYCDRSFSVASSRRGHMIRSHPDQFNEEDLKRVKKHKFIKFKL